MKRFWNKANGFLLPLGCGLLIVGLWYLAAQIYANVHSYEVQRIVIPFPHQVAEAAANEANTLYRAARRTATAALTGFISAVTIGYLMAMILASAPWVKRGMYPWVLVLQMTPVVVLAPIFVIWLGQGLPSLTMITFLIGFFPVVANTTMGLVSTDRNLLELFQMSNASKAQEILLLRVPFAMPYFLTGLKIAGTLAPIGAITADLFAGSGHGGVGGIGFMVLSYNAQLKVPELFATAFTACLLGFVFVGSVNLLHWYLLKDWHDSMRRPEHA